MRKIVILCNTYYQLISAIQLKKSLFTNDYVIVLLSDHSRCSLRISSSLKKLCVVDEIIHIESKKYDYSSDQKNKLFMVYCAIKGKNVFDLECLTSVDEFIWYNTGYSTWMLYAAIYEKNPNVTISCYDEGILSYLDLCDKSKIKKMGKSMQVVYWARKILGKKVCWDSICNYYCYCPEYYKYIANRDAIKIPKFTNNNISRFLAEVFYIDTFSLKYFEKYIFFASIGDFEGEEKIGEVDIALRIAELVGKDNLLIKVHPRDTTDNFERVGLKVNKASAVPWEVIQLNYDFSEHIFLTVTSSSVLSISMIQEKCPRTYFLYNLVDVNKNSIVKYSADAVRDLFKSDIFSNNIDNIFVAKSLDDIL